MAWAKVGNGTAASADNSAIAPTWPAHSAGNVGIISAYYRSSGTLAISGGDGEYTLIANHPAAANRNLYIWARVATSATESAPTITPSGGSSGNTVAAFFEVFSGGTVAVSAAAGTSTNSSDTSAEFVAHTPADDNSLVFLFTGCTNDIDDPAAPSGFTGGNFVSASIGSNAILDTAHQIQTAATTVSAGAVTLSGSSASASIIVSLKVAGVGTTIVPNPAAMSV